MRALVTALRVPWLPALVAAVLYAALIGVTFLWLVPHSGGRLPLDYRFPTYGVDEAFTYLQLLPFNARDIYAGPVLWLDMAFPPALALTLALWSRNWGVQLWRVGPLAFVIADWTENLLIGRILVRLPDLPTVELIQVASYATLTKYVALVCMLFLLALTALRNRGERA